MVVQSQDLQALRHLEDIKSALDQSAIVALTDRRGIITHVNDKFCEISKYSRDELIGQNHRIIKSGHHPPEFFSEMWRTIGRGHLWRGEIKNRAKDGTYYWVDTTIVPFLDDEGRPHQYIAIRHDITERKRVEAELREQAALKRLGQLAAIVAHEVKNPLAGLRGAIEMIGRHLPPDSTDRRIVGDMVARIDSLNQLVDEMLAFARPRPPETYPVAIGALVREAADLIAADPAMQDVTVDILGADPVLDVDAGMMRSVFLNLLLNAAQAMEGSGRVTVTIDVADDVCRVGIADSGPGIPPGVREHIFEPFFTTKHRGTGLGLAVAQRAVELHGGGLTVDCPPEGGTIMTVTLGPTRQEWR
jgi:PAS domain S-box-containing protein